MAAKSFELDPDQVRGFARIVYAASDAVGGIRADSVLQIGAGACGGTALATGLSDRAAEQRDVVKTLSESLDGFGDAILGAVDAFMRIDSGKPDASPSTGADRL